VANVQATATHDGVTVEMISLLRTGGVVYQVRVFRAGQVVPETLESHRSYDRVKGFFDGMKAARGLW
jgi:predicted O-methyltransferase YrrM